MTRQASAARRRARHFSQKGWRIMPDGTIPGPGRWPPRDGVVRLAHYLYDHSAFEHVLLPVIQSEGRPNAASR